MDDSAKLTAPLRQIYRIAALGLAIGMSIEEAASHAHITEDRLKSYMRDGRFQEFLTNFNNDVEGKIIERMSRRRTRALGKLQIAAEDAAEKVISLMNSSDHDSVSLKAAEGILRQVGIDMQKLGYNDELEDPEGELKRKDPGFLPLEAETMKEITSG